MSLVNGGIKMDTVYPLDSQMKKTLEKINKRMIALKHPPLRKLKPKESRYFHKEARKLYTKLEVTGIKKENREISTKGNSIPIRIYKPLKKGPFPVMVYFTGGGWVFGDLDSADNVCSYISKNANCIVISVDYRRSPENKYPAALEDALQAIKWTFNNIKKINGDFTKVFIGGESSGGNIAAAAALKWRDIGNHPIFLQLLITPVVRYSFDSDSYGKGYNYNLSKEKMEWFWNHYLEEPSQGLNQYVSPLFSEDLSGLPPALIITVEYDPLMDEGQEYALSLEKSGVNVDYICLKKFIHGFPAMIGEVDIAKQAFDLIITKLHNKIHFKN